MSDHPIDVEPLQHPLSPGQPPTRRDTQSTIKSTTSSKSPPISIAPGLYSLRLNGHCPKCHHFHKAAAFSIKISGHLSHTTIKCERCGAPWLALGGNSTCWSLLSTQTIDVDPTNTVFQTTLVQMVRALAAVGSPALASVPESREQSVQSKHDLKDQGSHPSSLLSKKATTSERIHLPAPDASCHKTNECSRGSAKNKRALSLLTHLRSKIKEQFAMMRKFHSERFTRATKEHKLSAKGRGKLPVRGLSIPGSYSTQAEPDSRHKDDVPDHKHVEILEKEEDDAHQKAVSEAADRVKRNEERLKAMTSEERANWIREQLSDFKCRCQGNCQCRRSSTRSDIEHQIRTVSSQTQLTAQNLAQRRISTDIAGIGADFEGVSSMYSGRMSIDSTTRLSQAATVVSVETSRPALPFLPTPSIRQRQAPRSSRPQSLSTASIPASRLREQLRLDENERRSSMDSSSTERAVTNFSGTTEQGGEDFTALVPSSMLVENEAEPSLQDPADQHTSST
jgi:hypothetical protein